MKKKTNKKTNSKVGNENKREQEMQDMVKHGEMLGDAIIGLLMLTATDWKGMGSAAIGMAKALAALNQVADAEGVAIEDLYRGELSFYEDYYADVIYREKQKENK